MRRTVLEVIFSVFFLHPDKGTSCLKQTLQSLFPRKVVGLEQLPHLGSDLCFLFRRLTEILPVISRIFRFQERSDGLVEELHVGAALPHHIAESLRRFVSHAKHFNVQIVVVSRKAL